MRSLRWSIPHTAGVLVVAAIVLVSGFRPDSPTPTVFEQPEVVRHYQEAISTSRLESRLRHLASDAFEGRETGTDGQRAAARFLASTYHEMGLLPPPGGKSDGPDGHLQEFVLYGAELYRATLRIERPGLGDVSLSYDPRRPGSNIYLAAGTIPEIAGPIEFRGLEPAEDRLDYEDYAVLHAGHAQRDAVWVLSFAPERLLMPAEATGPYRSTTTWPRLNLHVRYGEGPLPLGYILIAPPERVMEEARLAAEVSLSVGRLTLEPGTPPYGMPPVYVITPTVAEALLSGTGVDLDDLRELESRERSRARLPLRDVRLSSHIDFPVRPFETENVAAYVEGIDPALKDEFIVLSAHYDHVGVNPLLDGDTIFNGADDNASGNAAILEIAEAFMQARREGRGPRRSVAFVHFTGEEKGILGSRYYADVSPLFPIDATVANINLDMIGRSDPTRTGTNPAYVYVIGSRLHSEELHDITVGVNAITEIDLDLDERFNTTSDPNQFYRRSDQWNFGKYGVPFIFFFTGTHEDYHRPTDEADRVDFDRTAHIARLIFGTTWQLANQDHRPARDGNGTN